MDELIERCPWRPDPEDKGMPCGKPATDWIVFDPESATVFPDPRVPVCAEHFGEVAVWIGANLGRVVGAGDRS